MNTVDIETIFDEMQYIVECFLVNIFHLIIEFDWEKNCCCKVCRKRAIFVGTPNLTMKNNCGLGEPKPC